MRGVVLITDVYPAAFLAALEVRGLPIVYLPQYSIETLRAAVADAEIWVLRTRTHITARLVAAAPNLKLVIRTGSGVDHIDTEALRQRGVRLVSTPEGNCDAVGEQAVGLLLALLRHTLRADAALRRFEWRREANRGEEIGGKTVGIIGYGHTGRAVARRLTGFGARVLAYDKYRVNYGDTWAEEATSEVIFEAADVLTLHVPLAPDTRYLVDSAYLQKFRKPIRLLNLSRGEVVQTAALLDALAQGRVLGAALDVFEHEVFETLSEQQRYEIYALAQMDNVILTPHLGGITRESAERLHRLTLEAIWRYLDEA